MTGGILISPLAPLLGLLMRGDQHGYALKRIVDAEFDPYWRIDFAQLYRSLAKMTRAGWVKARMESGAGGPERKLYSLTARGRRAFEDWLADPARDRDEFLVKVRLASACGAPFAHLIEPQRATLQEEHHRRAQAHHAARQQRDLGHLAFTHAALRETETSLATLDLCETATPPRLRACHASPDLAMITGSDDPLLTHLARLARVQTNAVGSLNGLMALAQHQADAAGTHLLDLETGEYNLPFIKHFLPEEQVVVVNLAIRENGLMIAPGNPKEIRGVRDLARRDVHLINRQRGAGTRVLFFSKLRAARIAPSSLRHWERAVSTHDAVAAAIAAGNADVGPGLRQVAQEWELEFILLGEERYDLVIPYATFNSPRARPFLEALHSPEFRHMATALSGYDLSQSGKIIAHVK